LDMRKIGDLEVTIIGIGCNNFGSRLDSASTDAVVHAAMEVGINFFDTADVYGDGVSEEYLAKAGLAEMRALIFELRPESLATEGLIAALEKQAASVQARHELAVYLTLCDEEPDAPLEVKEAVYRIAQEALNNTVKHAQAERVELRLEQDADEILLEVRDDGGGFDPESSFPGHLGLKSMRERVARLGGTLRIESAPGEGTRIRAQIPPGT
jgi:signal transduction histidine kinase